MVSGIPFAILREKQERHRVMAYQEIEERASPRRGESWGRLGKGENVEGGMDKGQHSWGGSE